VAPNSGGRGRVRPESNDQVTMSVRLNPIAASGPLSSTRRPRLRREQARRAQLAAVAHWRDGCWRACSKLPGRLALLVRLKEVGDLLTQQATAMDEALIFSGPFLDMTASLSEGSVRAE
jgi:hypothetical protein